ncbi:hypothetical protein HD554DRAFT_2030693, partial [Boletus coccyginus]
ISSPNSGWIPEPFVDGNLVVQARADGRLGEVDIFQWPQLFNPRYPWSVAILRKGFPWDSMSGMPWAWYDPKYEDFDRLPGSSLPIGFLRKESLEGLRKLNDETKKRFAKYKSGRRLEREGDQGLKLMLHVRGTLNHLERFPLSWRDIVACVSEYQRATLDILAYFDYYDVILPRCEKPTFPFPEVNQRWMGAFTREYHFAEMLFRAGVPVWFIRPDNSITMATIINEIVTMDSPHVVMEMYSDPVAGVVKPFPVWYSGSDSMEHQCACRRRYKEEQMEAYEAFVGSKGSQPNDADPAPPRGASSENRSKWVDIDHPLLPPRHLTWAEALATGAPVGKKAVNSSLGGGYRFPEPALLVTAQSSETRKRYLANWLVLRPLWLGVVAERDNMPSPGPKEWRAFLNSRPQDFQGSCATTRTAETHKAALDFFGDFLPSIREGTSWAQSCTVTFRGTTADLTTGDIPPHFFQSVVWELAEASFRADLLSLDKRLMINRLDAGPETLFSRAELYDSIFSSPTVGGTWDAPVPVENVGLLHDNFRHPSFLSAINSFQGVHGSVAGVRVGEVSA